LAQGEITDGQMLGGAAVAFFVGFGTGQAVQGRWSESGWMFALGEVATLTLMVYGVAQVLDDCFRTDVSCNQSNDARGETALIVGAVGFGVLRVWEIVDALSAPSSHNARVRELRIRTGQQPTYYGMKPFVSPKGDGLAAGLSWRF
ncbi:MAG: hypothetical protein NT062_01505, partial [Proteobacteria bacterium]|nr:hypothetical protein [Pseudomonadota bacterium]